MSSDRRIQVMIVDDVTSYVTPQLDLAYTMGIDLEHFRTWEEAEAELQLRFDEYDALILDGKGQRHQDSKQEDPSHLSTAISWINEQKGRGRNIYFAVNTGFYDEFNQFFSDIPMYDKTKGQEEQMFSDILSFARQTNPAKFKYGDVYELFEKKFLDNELRLEYIGLINKLESSDLTDSSGICKNIRRIQEGVYRGLNSYYKDVLPDHYFQSNGLLKFKDANKHLSGLSRVEGKDNKWGRIKGKNVRDIQGLDMNNLANTIYWITANNIHYRQDDERPYVISANGLKALIFGLNEQLLWYKQFVINN